MLQPMQLRIREVFHVDQLVARLFDRANQLVQLEWTTCESRFCVF